MVKHYSKNIQNVIQGELFAASQSIKIAVAWFTNDLLFQPLLLKLAIGVKVDVILNKDEINLSSSIDFNLFVQRGGNLYWNESNRLMHDKFCIIDDRVVITGSYNWTNKAEINYESISVFTDEQESLRDYNARFQSLTRNFAKQAVHYQPQPIVHQGKCPISLQPYTKLKFYHSVRTVKNGKFEFLFANTEENGLYAMLDNETFLPKTDYMFGQIQEFHFYCSTNIVWVRGETKWGLFDGDTLCYIIPPTFDNVQHDDRTSDNYHHPHFIVVRNGKCGLIDNKGKFLLTCEYDKIRYSGHNSVECVKNGKYGMLYCNCNEMNIIPCHYDSIDNVYYHDLLRQFFKLRQNNKYILCYNGKIASNTKYDDISHIYWCKDILFKVIKDGKIGIIKKDCSIVYECVLNGISRMHLSADTDSAILLQVEDKVGLVYRGEVVLNPIYDAIEENSVVCHRSNLTGIPMNNILILQKNGKYGIYNTESKMLIKCEFASIKDLTKHIIKQSNSSQLGITRIHNAGRLLKGIGCDDIYHSENPREARIRRDIEQLTRNGFDYRAEIKKLMEGLNEHILRLERDCRLGYDYDGKLRKELESLKKSQELIKKKN